MENTPQINDQAIDPHLETYHEQLEALVLVALAGRIDQDVFRQELERLVTTALRTSFLLAGGSLDDPDAVQALEQELGQQRASIAVLTDDIYIGRYAARTEEEAQPNRPAQTKEEGKKKLQNRLILWVFAAAKLFDIGKQYGPKTRVENGRIVEITETYRLGQTEEHCTTCLALNGVTLTIDEWNQLGIGPRHPDLECGGWRCDCRKTPEGRPSDGLASVAARLSI